MTLYLDTEFNGFNGELISMALVSSVSKDDFYEVLPLPAQLDPWVATHVTPKLRQRSIKPELFRARLHAYLGRHLGEPIYADWPEDHAHLLRQLCEPGGVSLQIDLTLRLIQSGPLEPRIPHNALWDALALMQWHQLELAA